MAVVVPLDVGQKMRRGVVGDAGMGQGPPAAALVEQDDAVPGQVEMP